MGGKGHGVLSGMSSGGPIVERRDVQLAYLERKGEVVDGERGASQYSSVH